MARYVDMTRCVSGPCFYNIILTIILQHHHIWPISTVGIINFLSRSDDIYFYLSQQPIIGLKPYLMCDVFYLVYSFPYAIWVLWTEFLFRNISVLYFLKNGEI